jgi:hypothetical protein
METRVWYTVGENQGTILALTRDSMHRITVKGDKAKQEVPALAGSLAQGQLLAGVGEAQVVLFTNVRRVEIDPGGTGVKIIHDGGGKPAKVDFSAPDKDQARDIAQTAAQRARLPAEEWSEDIPLFEALIPPVFLGAIVGVLWFILYTIATELANGAVPRVRPGGGRGRALKGLFVTLAKLLGMNGTLVVGAVLLTLFVYWAVMRVVKRPQKTVWGDTVIA